MTDRTRILVGVIGAPHGVRGEVRLKSFTAVPGAIATYGPLASEDGRRCFTILNLRPVKDDMVVVRMKELADRTAAEAVTNLRLYVDRARLPPADEDEFYHADLIGLRAETADATLVGHVVAMQNFGAGDLLEVAPALGETILVPFTKVFVPIVDVPGGRVVLAEEALSDDAEPDPDEPRDG